MLWSPPMMLVSIVGQASFHTARPSGPSMMDRSYLRRSGTAAGAFASVTRGCATGAETSVILICRTGGSQIDNQSRFLPQRLSGHTARSATDAATHPHFSRIPDFGENLGIGSTRRFENVKAVIRAFDPMHLPICLHVLENRFHHVRSAERIASAVEAYDRNLDSGKMRIAELVGFAWRMQRIREQQQAVARKSIRGQHRRRSATH